VIGKKNVKRETENMIDIGIIRRFKGGEEEAFYELVMKYKETVSNIAYRYIRDKYETEDVVQEIFIQVYKSLRNFKEKSTFFTWLYSVAINVCRYYKRTYNRVESIVPLNTYLDIPDIRLTPLQILENKEIVERVNMAIDKLSDELKSVLILKEVEGLSYKDIARILKISVGTVKSRLHNARILVGKEISDYNNI